MTDEGLQRVLESNDRTSRPPRRMFRARIGQFKDRAARALMDELASWVAAEYREELAARPSKHVYIRNLPEAIVGKIDRLRDSETITSAILEQFPSDAVLTPMKNTDELYISHYNKDFGGDHGLFTRHYDGNLRFLPIGAVVRSLIYLQSDATYTVVFGDSGVEKAFVTYDFGLLDFHRELHWVEGRYNPDDRQRILLKCNYLVAPKNAAWITRALLAANSGVFYLVKAAMEYSKSPRTPPQHAIGYLCNLMRLLNNISPLIPILLGAAALAGAGWGLVRLFAG